MCWPLLNLNLLPFDQLAYADTIIHKHPKHPEVQCTNKSILKGQCITIHTTLLHNYQSWGTHCSVPVADCI
ncbi:hypothetical protein XELAEV_18039664mg [Xenopus laevis]|uniref:Uncharacterized protein n=1 Tax=Xenopus laevis TaxID=8355 RepID=A0A974C810_XENLA|nr:hypothetical protein XELAEV_18039664mg [Xenopus laevis]